MAPKSKKQPKEPLLEWIAAAIGLVLTLGIVAVIGREAVGGEAADPPAIAVRVTGVVPAASAFLVEIEARNLSGATAAAVQIEGELKTGETSVETSGMAFDYLPGHATRKGGLFFREDPRKHRLELRALGYQEP